MASHFGSKRSHFHKFLSYSILRATLKAFCNSFLHKGSYLSLTSEMLLAAVLVQSTLNKMFSPCAIVQPFHRLLQLSNRHSKVLAKFDGATFKLMKHHVELKRLLSQEQYWLYWQTSILLVHFFVSTIIGTSSKSANFSCFGNFICLFASQQEVLCRKNRLER